MSETTVKNRLYQPVRDEKACTLCLGCLQECTYGVYAYEQETEEFHIKEENCVNCKRCSELCPENALYIRKHPRQYRESHNWSEDKVRGAHIQAQTGSILLSSMGNPAPGKIYWDHLLLNASQVTNPSLDPLREPMEVKTFLGSRPDSISGGEEEKLSATPLLELETPIMFAGMSFGSISLRASKALAAAASDLGTMYNTGEGGLHRDLYQYGDNTIVQVASGRFGVHDEYLQTGSALEIKIGQGAKPGIGGHLPGKKVSEDISRTRMIPEGTDALSPAPHHDIYSIEDLRQLIYSLKEATNYQKPVAVKIAAVHNAPSIAVGIATAGADIIVLDGYRGGTGAAPTRIRNNVGLPLELALAAVDERLREENIRNNISLVAGGSIRSSADVTKAIALGADAVTIGTAALLAMGCRLCRSCSTGSCAWGIATQKPQLVKRLDPERAAEQVINLVEAWTHELQEMLGGMGINAIESLRGNRRMLRGVNLTTEELKVLGIKHAGR